jgi:hypothetical protein
MAKKSRAMSPLGDFQRVTQPDPQYQQIEILQHAFGIAVSRRLRSSGFAELRRIAIALAPAVVVFVR